MLAAYICDEPVKIGDWVSVKIPCIGGMMKKRGRVTGLKTYAVEVKIPDHGYYWFDLDKVSK